MVMQIFITTLSVGGRFMGQNGCLRHDLVFPSLLQFSSKVFVPLWTIYYGVLLPFVIMIVIIIVIMIVIIIVIMIVIIIVIMIVIIIVIPVAVSIVFC